MEPQTDISRIKATWSDAFVVWWAFFWRSMWYSALASMLVSIIVTMYAGIMHMPLKVSYFYSVIIAVPMVVPIQIWVVLGLLRRKQRVGAYRLMLMPEENPI